MVLFRNILWVLIILICGVLAWVTLDWNAKQKQLAESPYGVPFELVTHSGDPITQAEFQKKPTALFFGFTNCPEICPTTLFELDHWLKAADPDGTKIQSYMVTVDPERDTTDILKNYIGNVSKRIIGISGEPAEIKKMLAGFNIYFKKVPIDKNKPDGDYSMDHTASVFLLDKDGRFKSTIAYQENQKVAVQKLQNLLK